MVKNSPPTWDLFCVTRPAVGAGKGMPVRGCEMRTRLGESTRLTLIEDRDELVSGHCAYAYAQEASNRLNRLGSLAQIVLIDLVAGRKSPICRSQCTYLQLFRTARRREVNEGG
jgi:hypothetical protein